jgi:hypothetical protein
VVEIAPPGRAIPIAVGCVCIPQEETLPGTQPAFLANLTISGGLAPARAYIEELLPDVLEGRIEPGRVLDRTVSLDGAPDGYRAMAKREAVKGDDPPMSAWTPEELGRTGTAKRARPSHKRFRGALIPR